MTSEPATGVATNRPGRAENARQRPNAGPSNMGGLAGSTTTIQPGDGKRRSAPGPAGSATPLTSLLAHYNAASAETRAAGRDWYPAQWRRCQRIARATPNMATGFGPAVTPHRVAAIFAACSPRVRVAYAWGVTERAVRRWSLYGIRPTKGHFGPCVDKARRILIGEPPLEVLSGPKTRAFYRNITGDADAVTIDTWAAKACGLPTPKSDTDYDRIAALYRVAANAVGETPRDFQAIVWCQLRGSTD